MCTCVCRCTKAIIGKEFIESIDVCSGLRQACTMAPVLFSLYFGIAAS